jgi:hypothetical protein
VLLVGCSSIGPGTIPRDRYEYSSAIGESWKRQALLNIVKLRYLDPPLFVDVAQILGGYTLEGSASIGGGLSWGGLGSDTLNLGMAGKYTDRPTITYVPLTGDRFLEGIMRPLRPETVFSTIQTGYRAGMILYTTISAINGLRNDRSYGKEARLADERFLEFMDAADRLQESDRFGMRVVETETGKPSTVLFVRGQDAEPEIRQVANRIKELLGLAPDLEEYRLVYGSLATNLDEIAVQTRSVLHVLMELSARVDVPERHVAEGRATRGLRELTQVVDRGPRLFTVQSSETAPGDAYVSVHYRNHWFWIPDTDLDSKRIFALVMLLFTLADTGEPENLPMLTVPAG